MFKRHVFLLLAAALCSLNVQAQIYPVVVDAEGNPIAPLIDKDLSVLGTQLLEMLSLKGFTAFMSYESSNPDDLLGIRAAAFFEDDNCQTDPILLPQYYFSASAPTFSRYDPGDLTPVAYYLNNYDFEKYKEDREDGDPPLDHLLTYRRRTLIEYNGEVRYVPANATESRINEIKSVRHSLDNWECRIIAKCDLPTPPEYFDHYLLQEITPVGTAGIAPEGSCEGQEPYQTFPETYAVLRLFAYGFRLSETEINDPAVTGFFITSPSKPLSIQFMDIDKVMADGFEAQTGQIDQKASETVTLK